MGNLRNPNKLPMNLLAVFSILQFSLISTLSSARFSPIDNHLIDCGSSSISTTLDDHRVFFPDSISGCSGLQSPGPKISVAAEPNPSLDSSPLYRTARVFTTPSSYEFKITKKGIHLVRLHFYPFSTQNYNLSSAHFHVSAAGFVLLSDFSFGAGGETALAPVVKEYFIRVQSEKLVISFVPACPSSFAFINAIEVVSAPGDLIADAGRLVNPDRIEKIDGLSKQALETLYRINVGGPKVTPFNDTLWRTWVPDTSFVNAIAPSKTVAFSGRIKYQKDGATREVAPDSVYNTARILDNADTSDKSSNLTWVFSVNTGYSYLIRLHFCDIASLALNQLYFNVYINGYLASEDFDLSDATGQYLASPYYVDFVANVESSGLLNISIGASKLNGPWKINGLLNGLEIMKVNNTVGSLNGELPVALVLKSPRRITFGALVRSVVCGFAFVSLSVIGFMMVLKWRAESRDQVAWSPLPVDVSGGKLAQGSPLGPGKLVYF